MRRSIPAAVVVVVGLVILLDFLIVNPALSALAGVVLEAVIILFAAAAVLGAALLALRHGRSAVVPGDDRFGSWLVLGGMALVLGPGLLDPAGANGPLVRWMVAALIVPIGASMLALVAIFIIPAARRGMRLRPRETAILLLAAIVSMMLLLPLGGAMGSMLGSAADWALEVPIRAVFGGLLIAVALSTAVAATHLLFGLGSDD